MIFTLSSIFQIYFQFSPPTSILKSFSKISSPSSNLPAAKHFSKNFSDLQPSIWKLSRENFCSQKIWPTQKLWPKHLLAMSQPMVWPLASQPGRPLASHWPGPIAWPRPPSGPGSWPPPQQLWRSELHSSCGSSQRHARCHVAEWAQLVPRCSSLPERSKGRACPELLTLARLRALLRVRPALAYLLCKRCGPDTVEWRSKWATTSCRHMTPKEEEIK